MTEEQIKQKAEAEADKVIIGSGMDRASVIHLKHLLVTMYMQGATEATKELEKENAELKAQQFSLRNERNTFLAQNEQYEEDLIDFNDQLTKAKVCLEQLVSEITVGELEVDPNVLQQAENFLKDIEK